jgi:hypothetical protein
VFLIIPPNLNRVGEPNYKISQIHLICWSINSNLQFIFLSLIFSFPLVTHFKTKQTNAL